MSTKDQINKQLSENPVILYMKGTPDAPSCGFSQKAAECLKSTGIKFAYINILESPFIMERLPEISNFPTFPQLFIKSEIIGGSDIIEQMLNSGDLLPMLKDAVA